MGNQASNLYQVASDGDLTKVKELLSKGTGTGYRDELFGDTALIRASLYGHHEIVRTLLEYKADIEAKDKLFGNTALIRASENGHEDVVRTLHEYGAEVNAQTNLGDTALIWASRNCRLDIVRTLLEYGADINAKTNRGRDALYWACIFQKWEVAEFLLLKGADPDVKDKNGDSALNHINKHKKQEMLTRVQRALASSSSSSSFTSNVNINPPAVKKHDPPPIDSYVPVPAIVTELEEKIASLTSQLNEASDRLSSLNQQLDSEIRGSGAMIQSLTSQLNESSNKLSEVEKRNKLLSGDHDALSNISLEQCDELILTSHHNQERLLQRRATLMNDRQLCVICQDAQKTRLLQPCGHYCLCETCASNVASVKRCPLCNTTITGRITVFD